MKKFFGLLIFATILSSCAVTPLEDETNETNEIELQATEQGDSVNSNGSGNSDPDRDED